MSIRALHSRASFGSVLRRSIAGSIAGLVLWPGVALAQAPPLDHFMCYAIRGVNRNAPVVLEDQFDKNGPVEAIVNNANFLCNPARKLFEGVVTDITDRRNHLKWYRITTPTTPSRTVVVRNQFGANQTLKVGTARWLAVPAQKDNLPAPEKLDHFKCYSAAGSSISKRVTLEDQFEHDRDFTVLRPLRFCNPVLKRHGNTFVNIQHPEAHLVCYDVARLGRTVDQFGTEAFQVRKMTLCVPSDKLSFQ